MKTVSHSSLWIQIVLWTLLVLLPVSVIWIAGEAITSIYIMVLGLQTLTWLIIFYLNYLLFIPRLLFRHKGKRFIAVNLLTAIALPLITQIIYTMASGATLENLDITDLISIGTVWVMFLFLIFTAISLRSMQRNNKLEAERNNREKELASLELERLKSQLNPHFLFNSLNNISALSAIDTEATQEAIGTLSSMLRYVLYDTAAPRVSLTREIQFMNDYIALMRLRYTCNLHIHTSWPQNADNITIPPLLFISLLENAFKYGASSTDKSEIDLQLHIPAEGEIVFRLSNTVNQSRRNAEDIEPGRHGVGLRNLRRRLELLYPGCHLLQCRLSEDGTLYEAELSLSEKK